ncbi:DNA cytosine methyltransferase [Streptomyces sp. SP18CS02]|uniref:DNA cytosine methyltransferase n=1 Tax=Streptomyces sp. SP18CS02 TaxID=3002531 RepID=UPI002E76A15E|nr:DNA (cytosine-5-)-methyltransferase [Streptomyces sp. SP18CS02]MEE1752327.1 DNA (cytosine-5-)-methyltransferase [Streptomyces sp. SP18CS02]
MLDGHGLTTLEICAGGGGQAIGLEQAGFEHVGLVEQNPHACATLRLNRPGWKVIEGDVRDFLPGPHIGQRQIDLLSGGIPCTPYSIAGKQLGSTDERDLLPEALRLARTLHPRAIMLENVSELVKSSKFKYTREKLSADLQDLGYSVRMDLVDAQNFGVPQRRVRAVVVAMRPDAFQHFNLPLGNWELPPTVGEVLEDSMGSKGWTGAKEWARLANDIAPTLVGGSMKHGGGDLGPDRAKNSWAKLAVNGNSLSDDVPDPDFVLQHGVGRGGRTGYPRLTAHQAALIQGFPPDWQFAGGKTARYKQIGNAFPPPVARTVGTSIAAALHAASTAG